MEDNSKKNVIFRRIGGRIVPIKVNGGVSKEEKKGLGLIAGGIGLGAAGAGASGSMVNLGNKLNKLARWDAVRAKHQRKMSMVSQMILGNDSAVRNKAFLNSFAFSQRAVKRAGRAKFLRRAGIGIGIMAAIGAESLIQAGLNPILDRRLKEKDETKQNIKKSFAVNIASTGAYVGAAAIGMKSAGARKALRLFATRKP